VLYRRGGLSHALSYSLSHRLSHDLPVSGPIVPPAREGLRLVNHREFESHPADVVTYYLAPLERHRKPLTPGLTKMRSLAGLVERAALIPQVKLNLHPRRDPHNSNSELFLLDGLARANHDLPCIVHSIEQHNFVRIHKTLRTTPAMAAKVTERLWEIGDIVGCWKRGRPRK
jgi:hypothetical protein